MLGCRHHQRPPHHQALLVGQRQAVTRFERSDGCFEARRADDPVDHGATRSCGQLDQGLHTPAVAVPEQVGVKSVASRIGFDSHHRRVRVTISQPCEFIAGPAGGHTLYRQTQAFRHLEGLPTDRSRCPQDNDRSHRYPNQT